MHIVILNQTFYPDVASTAQHASDLAAELVRRGHSVTAVASRRAYDSPEVLFPASEMWKGVRILRVSASGFGKGARWRRALDFASFFATCALRLARLPRFDVVVGLTSPPLISCLGTLFARLRGGRFVFWVMDLNPDEAVAAGWLPERSLITDCLRGALRYSMWGAGKIVVLDRFMRGRIVQKGISGDKIEVIPPWPHDEAVQYDRDGREAFRAAHGLAGKFVVMYSGNHSPCHPLDTVLEAAARLSGNPSIAFCFVGGGSEFAKVRRFAGSRKLANVVCLPYQPLEQLSASLSAADLHVVAMGNPFVGIVHPCKIYNILALRIPVLYIGPSPSHVTEMLPEEWIGTRAHIAAHGDVERVVASIEQAARAPLVRIAADPLASRHSQALLVSRMCQVISGAAPARAAGWLPLPQGPE